MIAELFAGVLGLALGAGASLGWIHVRRKAREREMYRVATAIADYFRDSGVVASAYCERLPDQRIVALIEVEPNKRFRSSFLIEHTLKDQVLERAGVSPDLVFWRFPLSQKAMDDSAAPAEHAAPAAGTAPGYMMAPVALAPVSAGAQAPATADLAALSGKPRQVSFLESGSFPQPLGEMRAVEMPPKKEPPRLASPVVSQMAFVQARARAGQAEYDIDEVPWEHFEQAVKPEADKSRATGS